MENQKHGFVSFRSRVGGKSLAKHKKDNDDDDDESTTTTKAVVIPEHLRKDAPDPLQHFQNAYSSKDKSDTKSSKDLAADASRLQQELAKVQAAKEALLLRKSKAKQSTAPPPPPPPPPGMRASTKKKKTKR